MEKPQYTPKDHRALLDKARLAQTNGDPQAKFVIAWMEQLLVSAQDNDAPALAAAPVNTLATEL